MATVIVRGLMSIVILAAPATMYAQGFIETFSGLGAYSSGSYDGLDNSHWNIQGDGELVKGGYSFENSPAPDPRPGLDEESDVIGRIASGACGFHSKIIVRDLSLKSHFSADASAIVRLGQGFESTKLEVWLAEVAGELDPDPKTYHLIYAVNGELGGSMLVASGKDVSLEIEYDHVSSEVWFKYDRDVSSSDVDVIVGSLLFSPDGVSSYAEVNLVATGAGSQQGKIDEWSVLFQCDQKGDISGDGSLNATDVDLVAFAIRTDWNSALLDFSDDGRVDRFDYAFWVHVLRGTYFGDANLDGVFDSRDLVAVFALGEYEDASVLNSSWAEGDWNADGYFTSTDLVLAFQDGGYETGPRVSAVPESSGAVLGLGGLILFAFRQRKRCQQRPPAGFSEDQNSRMSLTVTRGCVEVEPAA